MIPRFNPLIRNKKYLTQLGQLKTMTRTVTGDLILTATTTIQCLLYQEEEKVGNVNPNITLLNLHRVCLPISIRAVVKEQDHLAQVTDRFGRVVLDDARITKIIDYNHWRHEARFFVAHLSTDLD